MLAVHQGGGGTELFVEEGRHERRLVENEFVLGQVAGGEEAVAYACAHQTDAYSRGILGRIT